MTREDTLLCAILQLLEHKKAWGASQLETLPEVFGEAVSKTVEVFQGGDIPRECLKLFKIVERLKVQWDEFQIYQSAQDKTPKQAFWRCFDEIENELTFAPPQVNDQPVESIPQLVREKCTPRMIATIYSWEGKGPFMKNGIPQLGLVQKEIDSPGSVLPADFVHPRVMAEREREAKYDNYLAKRAKALLEAAEFQQSQSLPISAPEAPETIDELVMQKVPDKQILKMKPCTQADIDQARMRIEAAARGDVSPGELAELEAQVVTYLGQHPDAKNAGIAEALGVETKTVAAIRRKLKESATAQ